MISLEQPLAVFFFLIVGCELNVNARMYKHDVTRFIRFFPVWLFHFVSGSFTEALQMRFTAKGPTISYVNRIKMSFVHP